MGAYGSPELSNVENYSYEKNMIYCSNCGTRYSKRIKKCPQCGSKHAQPFYNKWWFWFLIVLVIFAYYPTQKPDIKSQNSENLQISISEDEYKSKCTTISYSDAARNPNNYVGQYVVFQGQVIQVQENANVVTLRINVTQNEYGSWKDTIYVDYKRKSSNESRILENDVITVYGQMSGIKSYQAVLGNQISIPYLSAEYIVIN